MADLPSNERSSLWNIAAFGSLAGGFAYGMRGHWGQMKSAVAQGPLVSPMEKFAVGLGRAAPKSSNLGAEVLAGLGSYNFEPGVSKNILGALQSFPNAARAKQEVALLTYESLIGTERISGTEAMDIFRKLQGSKTVEEAYGAAEAYIKQYGASASGFRRQLETYAPWWIPKAGEGVFAEQMGNQIWKDMTIKAPTGMTVRTGGMFTPGQMAAREALENELSKAGMNIDNTYMYSVKDYSQVPGRPATTTSMWTGSIEGQRVVLPLEETGMTYGGKNLTTRYTTRGFLTEAGTRQSYKDYYVNLLKDTFRRATNDRTRRQAVKEVADTMNAQMFEDAGVAAKKGAIWNLPEQVAHTGSRARAELVKRQALMGNLSEEALQSMIAEGKLFPYGSAATVAKGTVMTEDAAVGLYGALGKWFPVEKQPLQGIRGEYGVAGSAVEAMKKGFGGTFGKYWGRQGLHPQMRGMLYEHVLGATGHEAPSLLTFYAKPGTELGFQSRGLSKIISEEEMLITKEAGKMLGFEKTVPREILLTEGMEKRKEILEALRQPGRVMPFKEPLTGGIGVTPQGERIVAGGGEGFLESVTHVERIDKERARIYLKREYLAREGQAVKLFAPGVKHQAHFVGEDVLKKTLRAGQAGELFQGVEAVMHGGQAQKNLYAQTMQQIEALGYFAAKKVDVGILAEETVAGYLKDPFRALDVKSLLVEGQMNADLAVQKNMVSLAKTWGFTQSELGATFGLLGEKRAGELGIAEAVKASTGVYGFSKGMVGGIAAEMGAGKMGTFEPTLFRALAMKDYGADLGGRMASEIVSRRVGGEGVFAAEKMILGMTGEIPFLEGTKQFFGYGTTTPIAELTKSNIAATKGRWIETGKAFKEWGGSSKFYLPGTEEMPSLFRGTPLSSGSRIPTDVEKGIFELQEALGGEEAGIAAKELQTAAHTAYAKEARVGGRIMGSSYLKAQTFRGGTNRLVKPEDMFTHFIPESAAAKFTEEQRKALAGGGRIPGLVWRHPGTSAESAQFAMIAVDKKLKEATMRTPILRGEVFEGGIPTMKDVGPTVGMKLDMDQDHYSIVAINDKETARRAERAMNNEIRTSYTQYVHNQYAMKEMLEGTKFGKETNIANMSVSERLLGGFKRLTAAKTETGKVNLALQKLKLGLRYNAPEKYRPIADVLMNIEEAAISGKHGVREGALFRQIATSVSQKDETMLAGVMEELFGPARDVSVSMKIPGIEGAKFQPYRHDPKEMSRVLMESYRPMASEIDNIINLAHRGKHGGKAAGLNAIIEQIATQQFSGVDPGVSAARAVAEGSVSKTAIGERAVKRAGTTWAKVKNVMGRAKGPALIGVAGAGIILAAAPSTAGSLSQPPPNREGISGGRNMSADAFLHTPMGPGMSPPPPTMLASKKVYDGLTGPSMSARADIRMHLDDMQVRKDQLTRQARGLTNTGHVTIRYKDDRNILDSHMLANKISNRL